MIQFALFFFIPLLINASSGNVFLIGTKEQSPIDNHFEAYPYENFEQTESKLPSDARNKVYSQRDFIKTAISEKKIFLYFSHASSIKFHIDHCLVLRPTFNTLKEKLIDCYERTKLTITLQPNTDFDIVPLIDDPNQPSSRLIQLLQDISNNPPLSPESYNLYLRRIGFIAPQKIHPPSKNEPPSKTPKQTPTDTNNPMVSNNSSRATNPESRLNRIKRAYCFIKATFNKIPRNYSEAETKEYEKNGFYIKLVDAVFIGTGFAVFLTCYISLYILITKIKIRH